MMRLVMFWFVALVVVAGAGAAVMSTERVSTGAYGSDYRFTWDQGCPDQSIVDRGGSGAVPGAGPNQCLFVNTASGSQQARPWHCPLDSDGTTAFVQDCDACGCPALHECQPTGICQACQLPACPNGMIDGREIVGSPSDPCAYVGTCYHSVIDYTVEYAVDRIPFASYYCPDHRFEAGTLDRVGDRDTITDQWRTFYGAVGCEISIDVTQPRIGELVCTERWSSGTCACMGVEGCYSSTVYVKTDCEHASFNTPDVEGLFTVPRGGEQTSGLYSCTLGATWTEYRVRATRDLDGDVTCSIVERFSTGFLNGAGVNVRMLECTG